ncbi:hypothetical protein HK101_001833 [Irineochytrium annulatum]|nr:hypothetical protein HK101_001833 [Irineochytrium annulatum]
MGVIEVKIIRARDLNQSHWTRADNAFVELYLEQAYKQRTTTINRTDSPTWNETFQLNFNDQHVIHFHVCDKEFIGKDSVGYAKVDFRHLIDKVGHTEHKVLDLYASMLDLTSNGKFEVELTVKQA